MTFNLDRFIIIVKSCCDGGLAGFAHSDHRMDLFLCLVVLFLRSDLRKLQAQEVNIHPSQCGRHEFRFHCHEPNRLHLLLHLQQLRLLHQRRPNWQGRPQRSAVQLPCHHRHSAHPLPDNDFPQTKQQDPYSNHHLPGRNVDFPGSLDSPHRCTHPLISGPEDNRRECWCKIGQPDGLLQVIDIFPEVPAPILLELQKKIDSWVVDH